MWPILLQVLLPAKGLLKNLSPAWATVRAFAWGACVVALLGAGGWAGAWAARAGEPGRIARAAKPLCDAAAAKAKHEALERALAEAELQRDYRGQRIETLDELVRKLEKEKADAQEIGPGRDDTAVPGDSPWLQQRGRSIRR